MTPTQLELHLAHKARLARFAAAARPAALARLREQMLVRPLPAPATPPVLPSKPAHIFVRRKYESKTRSFIGVPIAWRILRVVADEFSVEIADIKGPSRLDRFVIPRFVAAAMFLETTRYSLNTIGRHLGGRDHTCVINARKRMAPWLAQEAFRNRFDQMKELVGA